MSYTDKGAAVSGEHRYHLWRKWDDKPDISICWIMLNPSTADALEDDPTIRKCVGFAKRWGFNRVDILNLFSYRSSSPKALADAGFPNGDQADFYLESILGLTFIRRVVVAWGGWGRKRPSRVAHVLRYLNEANLDPIALGHNQDGTPQHPLYIPYARLPTRYLAVEAP